MNTPADRTAAARPMRLPWAASLLAIAAAGAIVALFAAAPLSHHTPGTPRALTVGRSAAMMALALLLLQFVLSGRLRWLDGAFGLDVLYRVHAIFGATAVMLLSAHPLLLAWPKSFSTSLAGEPWWHYWEILLGAATLSLAWVVVVTAAWRVFLRLPYHVWRKIHYLTFAIVAAALVHAFALGEDFEDFGLGMVLGIAAAAVYAGGFVWARIVRPIRLKRRSMEIRSVTRVSHNTVNVEMVPPEGRLFTYLPGQFAFVRFDSKAVSGEEHPFTLSSSPTAGGAVCMTIKDCGDWSGTVGQLSAGERARLHGPFGRFSYLLHAPTDRPIVLIAGGVGITPFLSMLRYMADAQDGRRVVLIWSNRTEKDILFRDEIESLEARLPALTVHHVLTRQEDSPGEKGRIDRGMLARLLAEEDRRGHVFLCGPPAMTQAVAAAVAKLGYSRCRIHSERFSLS